MRKYAEDEKALQQLKEKDAQLLQRLYNQWRDPFHLFLIRRFQCQMEDAAEVYPETMTRFYFNILNGKLKPPLESSLKTYCFGIGKNLFHKRFFNKYNEVMNLSDEFPDAGKQAEALDRFEYEDQRKTVEQLLGLIGDPCRELLELAYIKEYANDAIATTMGIPTEGAVRKRKFDCLKKMRKLLKQEFDL